MRRAGLAVALGLLVLVGLAAAGAWGTRGPQEARARLIAPPAEAAGFAQAEGPRPWSFPVDHGPHTDFRTEWWYYTGNLETADGRRFGYELTFFRRGLEPPAQRRDRPSHWATDQVYMAHFALTDAGAGRFQAFERFSRGAAGLAGAQAAPYRVWLDDWRVEYSRPDTYRLRAAAGDLLIDVELTDKKGPVLQGDRGYSRKGAEPGNASYYYSLTRLESAGSVRVGQSVYRVTGNSWMDREFSTNNLSPGQVGWDWFALQLDDGSELMLYQIRRADGTVDPFSSGTLIAPDGSTRGLRREDFKIEVGGTWRSPNSGTVYPARWTLTVPGAGLTLRAEPILADQELNVSYRYWEGAVRLTGERGGRTVGGSGYVEMTGYAGSIQGQF